MSDEGSSGDSSESDNNDNERMPDAYFPGEAKMENTEQLSDLEIDQRHTSIQSNSNSESSISLNEVNLNHLVAYGGVMQHLTPETRKFRTRSNDSSRSDVSDDILRANVQRRGSGSLSPRLMQFKRRESIDSIINDEKNHEHEINDFKSLNSKVEELLEKKLTKINDTPSNSPKRRCPGKQVYIPSISSTCSSPTRTYHRAQSPLTSTAGTSQSCRKRRFTDNDDNNSTPKRSNLRSMAIVAQRSSASLCSSTCSFDSDTVNSASPHSDHTPDFRGENEMDV